MPSSSITIPINAFKNCLSLEIFECSQVITKINEGSFDYQGYRFSLAAMSESEDLVEKFNELILSF